MNKKGITLVELIAVLALIGLLATILLPNINKIINGSKDTAGTVQNSTIIESAKSYVADNIGDTIDFDVTPSVNIRLKELVDGGYLSDEPKEPKTGKQYDLNTSKVEVVKVNNNYQYILHLNTK